MSTDDMFLEADIVNDLIDEGRPATTDEKIRAAIKVECEWQHVGENRQEDLYFAYHVMRLTKHVFLNRASLLALAEAIEPNNGGRYRTKPVNFNGFVGPASPGIIERAMENWILLFNDVQDEKISGEYDEENQKHTADFVIKEFLDIHPFSDGNDRIAWLLRVWILNQWDDPRPLPNYYGV